MNLTYERTENFDGDTSKALEIARNTFLPNDFEIIQSDDSYLEVKKTLSVSISHYRNLDPIEVISKAIISSKEGNITLRAELGGIKKIVLFYVKFILGIFILSLILAGIAFTFNKDIPDFMLFVLPIGLVLIFVFSILTAMSWFKAKSIKTLDNLMNDMLSTSKSYKAKRNPGNKMATPTALLVSTIIITIGFFVFIAMGIHKTNNISIFDELDSQVIEFVSEQYENTITQANDKNIYATCQVYYVDNSFKNYIGGMDYFRNNYDNTITGSIKLNSTSNLNQVIFSTSLKELKTEFSRDQARPELYDIYIIPDRPLEAGETYYYLWSNTNSRQLAPESNMKASLSMRNQPGLFAIETFFLVLPKTIKPEPENPPTSSKELENFNVYWWTKQVLPEEIHTENLVLTK